MFKIRQTSAIAAALLLIVAAACTRAPEPLTSEAASAKGDALLREMSRSMSATYYRRVSTGYQVVVF